MELSNEALNILLGVVGTGAVSTYTTVHVLKSMVTRLTQELDATQRRVRRIDGRVIILETKAGTFDETN